MTKALHFVAFQICLIWNMFWIYIPGYKGMQILSIENTWKLCVNLDRFRKAGL